MFLKSSVESLDSTRPQSDNCSSTKNRVSNKDQNKNSPRDHKGMLEDLYSLMENTEQHCSQTRAFLLICSLIEIIGQTKIPLEKWFVDRWDQLGVQGLRQMFSFRWIFNGTSKQCWVWSRCSSPQMSGVMVSACAFTSLMFWTNW